MKKLLSLSLVLFFVLSCSKDNSSPTAPDPENHAPVISSVTSSLNVIYPGETTTLTAAATDADSDDLTFSWSSTGGTFNTTAGSSVQWTAPAESGEYTITCTVSDGEDNDSETLTLQVMQNNAPVITSITASPEAVYIMDTCTLTAVATDADGNNLTYSWSSNSGTFSSTTGESVEWTAPDVEGEYSITCTVSDGEDNDTENLIITVLAVTGTVEDIDGNVYNTIKIGDQWWMMENLKVTRFTNGDEIPNVTDNSEWASLSSGAYCVYENDESYASTYGYLYNWFAVDTSSGLAPEGWRVPTNDDWKELEDYLGGSSVAGGKLKEMGTSHWASPNTGATNESCFTALPGGNRYYGNGKYLLLGNYARFWSSSESEYNSDNAWYLELRPNDWYSSRDDNNPKRSGFSVRCVKDN